VTLSPTKQQLLQQRLSRGRAAPEPLPRRPDGVAPPLSFAQERLWFMEEFAPGTSAYGSPLRLNFGPDFDPARSRRRWANWRTGTKACGCAFHPLRTDGPRSSLIRRSRSGST
jgi:hypothetical protein